MDVTTKEFFQIMANYRALFALAAMLFMILVIVIIFSAVAERIRVLSEKKRKQKELENISVKNLNYSKLKDKRKSEVLRSIAAPDNIDPAPNGYLGIDDAGKELYTRTFTAIVLPKNVVFMTTFASVFDFPGCTSSVHIKPIPESKISRDMDRRITVLASEHFAAAGDPNRTRKIEAQYREAYEWAEQVESGEQKFFEVGFVFTVTAESVKALNTISDKLNQVARAKGIYLSNCFAAEAEAFVKNAPFNNQIVVGSKILNTDPVHYFTMDKYSVSVIFNYSQSSFSHRNGIYLGSDMNTGTPFFFDLFDPTHDGFTLVIGGKTGSGKSATIKMFASRSILYGYKFVCIDSQPRKGTQEGEFASLAEMANGVNFQISNTSKCRLNPFEISVAIKSEKDSYNNSYHVKTVELNEKIVLAVNTLLTMLRGSKEFSTVENHIMISGILKDIVAAMYQDFGIYEGKPDSLYEIGQVVVNGEITMGHVKKKLPTMTDFYKRLLIAAKQNEDDSLTSAYNLAKMGLKDYVKELYYTEKSLRFMTREELEYTTKFKDASSELRVWMNEKGEEEDIITIKGMRAYFDGQSTFEIDPNCPFTNIDISQLIGEEKVLARQIAIDFVNECYIKKNSDDLSSENKMAVIFDECHENFTFDYARKTIDQVVRTARKRNVGTILSTQTIKEFDYYSETQAILKQAAAKFVFKQAPDDKEYLMKTLNLTEAQARNIVERIGGDDKVDTGEEKNEHRGEMCVVDGQRVLFCKVEYLESTESLVVATDSESLEKLFKKQVVA